MRLRSRGGREQEEKAFKTKFWLNNCSKTASHRDPMPLDSSQDLRKDEFFSEAMGDKAMLLSQAGADFPNTRANVPEENTCFETLGQ